MKKAILLAGVGFLIVSCGTTTALYDWKGYDDAIYAYVKSPDEKNVQNLIAVYEKMIQSPGGSRQVPPPGVYADYGFLMIRAGENAKALELLKMESTLYPESKPFIDRIIKRLEP